LKRYQELRALAEPLEKWRDLRSTILSRLAREEQYNLLIRIYLDAGEVDHALETLVKLRAAFRWGWRSDQLSIEVAGAAEEERPRKAIRLYEEAAEKLIAQRGRGNYAVAASYLARVRDLYRRLDEAAVWETTIARLREDNRRLRALKDELSKAGL
jgi:uncharacterized Zn finger protein